MRETRRQVLHAGLLGAVGLAGCTTSGDDASPTASPTGDATATSGGSDTSSDAPDAVGLETVAEGLTSPLAFADPGGEYRYVADQAGQIHVLEEPESEPFLDVTDRMVSVEGYSERGLLGLAFHPEYPDEPRVYVRYSAPPREGTPAEYSHTFVLSEFQVRNDGRRADPASERTLLEIPEPQPNHNAGPIAFGPDGYLFVTVGDGGGANDSGTGHVEDWYASNDGGNGQDVTENLLGSLLRIDVDERDGDLPYGVPPDNPLVDGEGHPEQYAWGLRNPWGISFDGEDLLLADVGQNRYEEVNRIERGGNYGWNVREGPDCFQAVDCPTTDDRGESFVDPVLWYGRDGPDPSGVAIVGGHVYRGDAVPALEGRYVFGDWRAQGRLFVATPGSDRPWPSDPLEVDPSGALQSLLAIGRDRDGELYLLTSERGQVEGTTGAVHRLTET